jgi:predicted acyl esterase
MTAIDRPWRRAGALKYSLDRMRRALRPPVVVHAPGPHLHAEKDVQIRMRDGTILRANVYRPRGSGPVPALLCAHPYGKDSVPARSRSGRALNFQYRMLRQSAPLRISSETSWEAPDPDRWTAAGYAVVNLDVRGAGRSDGTGDLLSDLEAQDVFDAIEWIAKEPWCDGAVGMLGVSYLAISQYKVAALRPPALRAIVPWEGFTDAYRDLFYPGGVQERGFSRLWSTISRRTTRMQHDIATERRARPLDDDWWRSLVPDLDRIEVPMLVCGSFSDNNLHSRGSFRAFERSASTEKHLYTHRGGKWATFYGEEAAAAQRAFLDRHLKGAESGALPPVRLEVRERGDRVAEVRDENEWPLARTQWTALQLAAGGMLRKTGEAAPAGSTTFHTRRSAASFTHVFQQDTEVTGPSSVRLWVSVDGADDVSLFLGLSKWSRGRVVPFEGSYGFGRELVATGWQRASARTPLAGSDPHVPDHDYTVSQPLAPGEIVEIHAALGPSATLFRAGDELRLHVAGRQLSPRNPLFGAFPGIYRSSRSAACTVHWGPDKPARVELPIIPF